MVSAPPLRSPTFTGRRMRFARWRRRLVLSAVLAHQRRTASRARTRFHLNADGRSLAAPAPDGDVRAPRALRRQSCSSAVRSMPRQWGSIAPASSRSIPSLRADDRSLGWWSRVKRQPAATGSSSVARSPDPGRRGCSTVSPCSTGAHDEAVPEQTVELRQTPWVLAGRRPRTSTPAVALHQPPHPVGEAALTRTDTTHRPRSHPARDRRTAMPRPATARGGTSAVFLASGLTRRHERAAPER